MEIFLCEIIFWYFSSQVEVKILSANFFARKLIFVFVRAFCLYRSWCHYHPSLDIRTRISHHHFVQSRLVLLRHVRRGLVRNTFWLEGFLRGAKSEIRKYHFWLKNIVYGPFSSDGSAPLEPVEYEACFWVINVYLLQRVPCRVQLIYADDLLAINSDHQSVAPSQDPLQAKGPLAQLQGQNSRSINLSFRCPVATFNNNLALLSET